MGSPPGCRPECVVSSECSYDKACVNQKCVDPCPGVCGSNAECRVNNHSPICSCSHGYTGNAFTRCYPIPEQPRKHPSSHFVLTHKTREQFSDVTPSQHSTILAPKEHDVPANPCVPSPCGPFSQCHAYTGGHTCSCLTNYFGSAPNCRPECTINAECSSNRACMNQRCGDPCPGACGLYAVCNVINHSPVCTCQPGYVGDPFTQCRQPSPPPQPRKKHTHITRNEELFIVYLTNDRPINVARDEEPKDPCIPSPCGYNAQCSQGICSCLPEYQGDPYSGCRPECVLNSECPRDRACVRSKCVDPCPGTCGQGAICDVINHIPMCTCPPGQTGNAFIACRIIESMSLSEHKRKRLQCGWPNKY